MPDKLLLHPKTEARIEEFALQPFAAVLITGQAGSGKQAVARQLAGRILDIQAEKLSSYPYFTHLRKPEDKKEIPIDNVRQVIKEMRLKPVISGRRQAKRVILIENAGNLSEEAQNALLKSLEEPGSDTVFILTAETETGLLPTIVSRVQKLAVTPVDAGMAARYFGNSNSAGNIESAWQLSQGAAGLLSALLTDEGHPLKLTVDEAKNFLRMDRYHRTIYLDGLSSDKAKLGNFLNALGRVLAALHAAAVKSGGGRQLNRLSSARRLVNSAAESLNLNASPRLIAIDLALNLPV